MDYKTLKDKPPSIYGELRHISELRTTYTIRLRLKAFIQTLLRKASHSVKRYAKAVKTRRKNKMPGIYDFEKMLNDFEIVPGKRRGSWLHVSCPFCDDTKQKGGLNEYGGYYYCWKCEYHPIEEVLSLLLRIKKRQVFPLLKKYKTKNKILKKKKQKNIDKIDTPIIESLNDICKKYLYRRYFNPDFLEKKYGLKWTGIKGAYAYRLFIPIFYNQKMVSFQTRTIYKNVEPKYKTASKNNEIIHHKNLLYNLDNCKKDYCIVVEGVADVWRIGDNSCCTFGISFKQQQINLLSSRFKYVFLLYDPEPEAQKQAQKIVEILNLMRTKAYRLEHEFQTDPGDWTEEQVRILKEKIKKYLETKTI